MFLHGMNVGSGVALQVPFSPRSAYRCEAGGGGMSGTEHLEDI